MSRHPEARLNATALLSLLAGIFGTLCFFWGIGGVGAIILGIVGHGEIRRSEGRQYGEGFAIAGIVLGILHLVAIVIGFAALFAFSARPGGFAGSTPPTPPAGFVPPVATKPPPSPPPADQPGAATRETGTRSTRFGGVTLVDPGSDPGTLQALVQGELAQASASNQKLVLWVSQPDCAPCTGVSVALAHPRVQASLDGVRLVRVDSRDFQVELVRRGIPVDVLPGFALLGGRGEPVDYVNGGEWDADIPENIAPVLGSFVKGTYRKRRNPWRGPVRADETAL
ncbi:MAG TPA: DUF4190 domain-containing protein [Polyangiaceae bacterium]